jgi:beta-galactosidase
MAAFGGLVLGIVKSARKPGAIRLTATSPGLRRGTVTLTAVPPDRPVAGIAGLAAGRPGAARQSALAPSAAGPPTPAADASYSGSPSDVPANMLDGDPSTGWSNYYVKAATANLHAVSVSHASEWVSLTWTQAQTFSALAATFVTNTSLSLPASVTVTYWNGRAFVPVQNQRVTWATASGQPSTVTFDPVTTTQVRMEMTSPAPGTSAGFLRIAELSATSG